MLHFGGDAPDRKSAGFRVMGADLDPDRITEATGLLLDHAYRRGDLRHNGQPHRAGMWSLDSSRGLDEGGNHLEDHLRWLLDRLAPHSAAIRRICNEDDLAADFYCLYFMGQANSGFVISPATLAEIAALDGELGLDIYAEIAELELEQWVKRPNPRRCRLGPRTFCWGGSAGLAARAPLLPDGTMVCTDDAYDAASVGRRRAGAGAGARACGGAAGARWRGSAVAPIGMGM